MSKKVYISSAKRTPLGAFQGIFSSLSAPTLGAKAIEASIDNVGLNVKDIGAVYFGNVISAGLGQAPARQAALQAGLSNATPCTTVSKVCGSGMKAVMLAANAIRLDEVSCAVAGGMESMTNAPYLLPNARMGHRIGHTQASDAMFVDGLQDAKTGTLMGVYGQKVADEYNITRKDMDAFAIESLQRAQHATQSGLFENEIASITVTSRKSETRVSSDEQLATARPEKIPTLKPAFAKEGSITAANASSISDGAAALLLSSEHEQALAEIKAYASHAQKPVEFTLAPIGAIEKVLAQTGWKVEDVDLFEINEAFAVVTMLAMEHFQLPREKVNVHGGACALGHPLGASGARIIVTLLHALIAQGKRRGIASLCIGGGEATAIAIELVD